jgi:hypothetical protein
MNGGASFGMRRMHPILSPVSDFLQTKSTHTDYMSTESECRMEYSLSEGVEWCAPKDDKTRVAFRILQQFYDDRNTFDTLEERRLYYAKRTQEETRNEFDEVIAIKKEKDDIVTLPGHSQSSSYELGRKRRQPRLPKAPLVPTLSAKRLISLVETATPAVIDLLLKHNPTFVSQLKQHFPENGRLVARERFLERERLDYLEHRLSSSDVETWTFDAKEELFFSPDNTTTMDYNTPRLLLGQHYKNNANKDIYSYVLLPFVDLLMIIKHVDPLPSPLVDTMKSIVALLDDNEKTFDIFYSFERKTLRSLDLLRGFRRFASLWTLLIRLVVAHQNMEDTLNLAKEKLVLRWQLFIDTHIDLCHYIKRSGDFEDRKLLDATKNKEHTGMCAVQQYRPTDRNFAYAGNFMNLTECISLGNLYFDVRPKHKTVTLAHALIHLFGCKIQPQKCQPRGWLPILYRYIKKFPVFLKIYREIVRVALLGNYFHVRARPHFESRMQIYHDLKEYDDDNFTMWLIQNHRLVFHMSKEFHMYMVQSDILLDVLMNEKVRHWPEMKVIIRESVDLARLLLRTSMVNARCYGFEKVQGCVLALDVKITEKTRAWASLLDSLAKNHMKQTPADILVLVDDQMKYAHSRLQKVDCAKLKKGSYFDVMYVDMENFFDSEIINQHSTVPLSSESFLPKGRFLEDLRLVARTIAYHHSCGKVKDGRVPLFYLKIFGVSELAYQKLRKLSYMYEEYNLPDNAIPKYLKYFYEKDPRSFHLYHTLLRYVMQARMFRRYPLSLDYRLAQERALRIKKFKMPWEELDEQDDIYYYCPNCRKFKNPVCDLNLSNPPKNIYAQGVNKAIFNVSDGTLRCDKKTLPATIKTAMADNSYYNDKDVPDVKTAKMIRKYKEGARCCDTVLVPVHMMGWIQHIEKRKYIICCICTQPTLFETAKFGPLGVTCGLHGDGFTEGQRFLQRHTHLSTHSLEYQMRVLRSTTPLRQEDPSLTREEWLDEALLHHNKSNALLEEHRYTFCYHCKTPLTFLAATPPDKNPRNFANPIVVLESDRNNGPALVNVFLCESDFGKVGPRERGILTRNQLFEEIKRSTHLSDVNNQRITSRNYDYAYTRK